MRSSFEESLYSQTSKYFMKNQESLKKFLSSEFGYSNSLATLIVQIHNCLDKGQLMSLFILQDNNKYRHIFVPSQQETSGATCQVCGQSKDSHIQQISWEELRKYEQNFANNQIEGKQNVDRDSESFSSEDQNYFLHQPLPDLSNKKKTEILNQDYVNCVICYGNYLTKDDLVHIGDKIHEVCLNCMGEFLKQEILNLRIEKIGCPHCYELLSPDIIKQYVNNALFEKYQTFLKNLQIQKNPNFKWCPNPKCSVVISLNNKDKKTIKCPKCQKLVCLKCNREGHPNQSCDQVMKNIFKDLENASDIQKCKKCKALVQKIAGCNHMTCSVCKYQWCWLCGATYSDIHFSPLNPLGCAGMQNRNISSFSKCKVVFLRIFMVLLFIILLPIVLPLVMVFCGPVLFYNFLVRKVCYYPGCCCQIFIGLISLPIGIVIDPFVWLGAIIYFIPSLCKGIKNYFQRKRSMKEGSENLIKRRLLEEGEVVIAEA